MQAKDIGDKEFLQVVIAAIGHRHQHTGWDCGGIVTIWDLEAVMPDTWPYKVMVAKAKSLINRGLLDGCGCGCRGDFEITEAGDSLLATSA